jgi:hypothetical protein
LPFRNKLKSVFSFYVCFDFKKVVNVKLQIIELFVICYL